MLHLHLILVIKTCFVRADFVQGYFICVLQVICSEFFKAVPHKTIKKNLFWFSGGFTPTVFTGNIHSSVRVPSNSS